MRYFIEFAYEGSPYFGYQKQPQPNAKTVQGTLENALQLLLRNPIHTTAAGRTDTGVHAKQMFAHFDLHHPIDDTQYLTNRLNNLLPPSIAVARIFPVTDTMHARFSATHRRYQYQIATQKNPFTQHTEWQYWKRPLDILSMNQACQILKEYNDFESFARIGADNKTHLCRMDLAAWEQTASGLYFNIQADRFLRNMVRAIVGTMVEIGSGKYPPEELHSIIQQKNRAAAGSSAPAHGLYLMEVGYPDF